VSKKKRDLLAFRPSRAKSAVVALLTAFAALTLSLLPVGSAVTAAAQPWPGQLAPPAPAPCPSGETLIAPTSGWTDNLGVSHVTYRADPGIVAMVPPKGLTAGKVSAALMADVGMRAPSVHSPSFQRMVQQVLRLARNQRAPEFCRSAPDRTTRPTATTTVVANSALNVVQLANNWAGYATTEAERGGTPITDAFGAWTVPSHTPGRTPSAESTWVGIGGGVDGESSVSLIQTGTEMQTNEGFRSFWQAVGTGCGGGCGNYSSTDAVLPGDSVTGEVYWTSSAQACFYFFDLSRSTGSWDMCQGVSPYDPSSAEWINEWPDFTAVSYDNPHTVAWSAMLAGRYGDTLTSPFITPWLAIVMTPPGGGHGPYTCSGQYMSIPIDAATNSSGVGTSNVITCYDPPASNYITGP